MALAKNGNAYGQRLTTPLGRFSYPHVFKKWSLDPKVEGRYETTFLIPKSVDITPLKTAAEQVAKEAFGNKFKGLDALAHPPIRDGDAGEDANARGHWVIRAKTTRKPQVVGPDPKILIDNEDDVYGGAWGKLNITPGTYQQLGNWGVTWFLNAVQKVKDGERFGGGGVNPEEAFEVEADDTPF